LDAVIETTGFPTPGIMEMMASMDIRIVPNSPEELQKASAVNPLFSAGKIPGGLYEGMDEDIPVIVGYTIMTIRSDVADDTVYQMTKAIWENLDDIKASHASQELLSPEMIKPSLAPIAPIHPGALRYYKEQGWVN
jgi:TRAP transporter TAXI family solute receptor